MTLAAEPAREIPPTSPDLAASLTAAEAAAFLAAARELDGDDWSKPTDCAEWTVQELLAHVVGQFEGAAKPWGSRGGTGSGTAATHRSAAWTR
jgi:uncharacterized protein (TIGR03083 family)